MPVLRRSSLVPAPPTLVAGVLRDTTAATEALRRVRCRFWAPVRLLVAGDEVAVAAGPLVCRTRITRAGVDGLWSELAAGPAAALRHATSVHPDGDGSRVLDELTWAAPFGPFGRVTDPVLTRFAERLLDARSAVLTEWTERLSRAPVVVGAAIVSDGRLLAACRAHPPELAGRWELPGGAVEPGETEADALRRECREELGTDVGVDAGIGGVTGRAGAGTGDATGGRAGSRVGTDLPIGDRVLRIHRARLAPGSPEPVAREHRELRWVGPGELATLGWLDADRAVLPELRELLVASRP